MIGVFLTSLANSFWEILAIRAMALLFRVVQYDWAVLGSSGQLFRGDISYTRNGPLLRRQRRLLL